MDDDIPIFNVSHLPDSTALYMRVNWIHHHWSGQCCSVPSDSVSSCTVNGKR